MLWRCLDCKEEFTEDEIDEKEIDLEAENGVGGLFPDHHYIKVPACRFCGSEEIEEIEEEEEEEETE